MFQFLSAWLGSAWGWLGNTIRRPSIMARIKDIVDDSVAKAQAKAAAASAAATADKAFADAIDASTQADATLAADLKITGPVCVDLAAVPLILWESPDGTTVHRTQIGGPDTEVPDQVSGGSPLVPPVVPPGETPPGDQTPPAEASPTEPPPATPPIDPATGQPVVNPL